MITIEVLGTGCMKCKRLLKNVEKAVEETETEAEIIKIEDINAIMERDVMLTPALIIDGELIVSGRVPDVREISGYLME